MPRNDLPQHANLRDGLPPVHRTLRDRLTEAALALLAAALAVMLAHMALTTAIAIPTLAGPVPGCC